MTIVRENSDLWCLNWTLSIPNAWCPCIVMQGMFEKLSIAFLYCSRDEWVIKRETSNSRWGEIYIAFIRSSVPCSPLWGHRGLETCVLLSKAHEIFIRKILQLPLPISETSSCSHCYYCHSWQHFSSIFLVFCKTGLLSHACTSTVRVVFWINGRLLPHY